MRTQEKNASFITGWVRPLLIGLAVSIVVCVAVLMLMALLVQQVDVPRAAVLPMAIAAGALGAFGGGMASAIVSGQRGLVMGCLCGLALFLLILLTGFIRYTGVSSGTAFIKMAVLAVTGGLGGVLGVNRRR